MRRSQIDAILVEQTERRNNIISFICVIFVITLLSFALFFVFFKSDNKNYVTYSEKSNIDYKVFLKENDFFENEYLGMIGKDAGISAAISRKTVDEIGEIIKICRENGINAEGTVFQKNIDEIDNILMF